MGVADLSTWLALRRQELARGLDITLKWCERNVLCYMPKKKGEMMYMVRKNNHDAKMLISYRDDLESKIRAGRGLHDEV